MSSEEQTMRVAVLTISDKGSRGEREDLSGPAVKEIIEGQGMEVVHTGIIADEREEIATELRRLADDVKVNLIITTGGTGFSPRDVTPEATEDVIHRRADNVAQLMRAATMKITPMAALSRGVAGIRDTTLIINLPGSPKGAKENLEAALSILDHALRHLRGEILH
jgi:molybdenum cofactor synthesis domain-containing protein